MHNNYLLSRGRAFSISLTYRTVCEEVLKLCCPFGSDETDESLVYKYVVFPILSFCDLFYFHALQMNTPVLTDFLN